jgi:hypothetical protein
MRPIGYLLLSPWPLDTLACTFVARCTAMVQAVSGQARQQRYLIESTAGRPTRWRTDFIGKRGDRKVEDHPQAFLIDMSADSSIGVHFHQVDQFQVLVAGSGSLGGKPAPLIALHYVDRDTRNGPTRAGPHGLSIITMRLKCDPGATHQHQPEFETALEPGKQRYVSTSGITLSTEPVLQARTDTALENVLPAAHDDDGLGAFLLRIGANMETAGPDPRLTGGQFYLVLNGGLVLNGKDYTEWSTLYLGPDETPLAVRAGSQGLETLVLDFPRATA